MTAMAATSDASRRSLALAASLTLHIVLFSFLAERAVVRLGITPAPVLLTFVDAAARTAGPGERAAELRAAAGSPARPAPAPRMPPATPAAKTPDKMPAPSPPAPRVAAEHPPPPVSIASRDTAAPGLASVPAVDSEGADGGARGGDERSAAPAWAPSARVRYEGLLYAWMDRHKEYPMLASRRGLEGAGSVRVRIDRDGRVLERSVATSTGQQMLDQAALDMVRRSSPFPSVPAEYTGSSFEFVAPVEYRLR